MINTRAYFRFRWSHDHIIHRKAVRTFNFMMRFVPFKLKYAVGLFLRKKHPPYNLIKPGAVIVQVGAPLDTLLAGRSRAAYFCLLAGEGGRVVVVEPEQESIRLLESLTHKYGISNAVFVQSAAWSEEKTLRICVNPRHPASNFVDGTKEIDEKHRREFYSISIAADTLDNILAARHVQQPHLVSITTNGSEREIIKGMVRTIAHGVPYISLACTNNYIELMQAIGYEMCTYDDRGMTFRQSRILHVNEIRRILWPPFHSPSS